jgi:hypothetical protein
MTASRFVLMVTLGLTLLAAPLAAEAQRVARVSPLDAMEDTQARSDREMLR